MTVNIQSVNFKADGKLIDFIKDKLSKTSQFYDRTITTDVYLKVDNNHEMENKIVEMRMAIPGSEIVVTKEKKSFEEAADLAVEVLIRQLKKHKEKRQQAQV
ncbi:MAG: ribosome-associated translation inhibitor RaiA [Bacteroidota bacterium]|jgi:putative sigma-54 modulation protein